MAVLLLAIGSGVFSSWVMSHTGFLSPLVVDDNPVYTGFLSYWSYIILLAPTLPIALYITSVPATALHLLEQRQEGGNAPVFV